MCTTSKRLTARTVAGTANARDLIALRNSLRMLPELQQALSVSSNATVATLIRDFSSLDGLVLLITTAITDEPPITLRDGGLINPGFSVELDELRSASTNGKGWIAALESRGEGTHRHKDPQKSATIQFRLLHRSQQVDLASVPENYIRKQTTVNGERFITPELKEYESKVLGAEEKSTQLEYEIFSAVREQVAAEADTLMTAARSISQIDVFCSMADVAAANRYVRPEVNSGAEIYIKNGRHPVVERLQTGELFVPNDSHLDCEENQLLIITGPNMAGKVDLSSAGCADSPDGADREFRARRFGEG